MPDTKHQDSFEFEPAYEEYAGVKHEFTGTLFVPTESEFKRIEREQAERTKSAIAVGEPSLFVPNSLLPPRPRATVKMKMKTALRMRTRGE